MTSGAEVEGALPQRPAAFKILALSDEVVETLYSPELAQRCRDVSLVLGCGDLPFYYLEFVVTVLNVPLLYVPGNHDGPRQYLSDGRVVSSAEGCDPVDGRVLSVPTLGPGGPLLVAGLGGSPRYKRDGPHQYTEAEMMSRALRLAPRLLLNWQRYGRALDILITHAPPRGIHDRPDPAHVGFRAFCWLMDLFRPRLLLHGHAHIYRSDLPAVTRYRATDVINVYPQRVIEWEPERHGQPG